MCIVSSTPSGRPFWVALGTYAAPSCHEILLRMYLIMRPLMKDCRWLPHSSTASMLLYSRISLGCNYHVPGQVPTQFHHMSGHESPELSCQLAATPKCLHLPMCTGKLNSRLLWHIHADSGCSRDASLLGCPNCRVVSANGLIGKVSVLTCCSVCP